MSNYGINLSVGKNLPVTNERQIELVDPKTAVGKIAIVSSVQAAMAIDDTAECIYRELYYQSMKAVFEAMRDLVFKETGSQEKAVAWIASPFHKRIEREGI